MYTYMCIRVYVHEFQPQGIVKHNQHVTPLYVYLCAYTHTHMSTHAQSLSLSLAHTHTHIHVR